MTKITPTNKQITLLRMIECNGLRTDRKGRKYYLCPTSMRRRGEMIVPNSALKALFKNGWIDENNEITDVGKSIIQPITPNTKQ